MGTASYRNSSTAAAPATPQITPSPTNVLSNGTCSAECLLLIPFCEDWYWSKLYVSTTLTAATKYIVINRKTNTTSTKIVYADLPDGYTLPPTNAEGTQATVTTFGDLSTMIAYPTPYLSWDSGYSWSGTLPTVDGSSSSICSTVTGSVSTTRTYTGSSQTKIRTHYSTETYSNGSIDVSTRYDWQWVPTTTYVSSFETGSYATVLYGDTFQRTVPPVDSADPYGFLYTLVANYTLLWPKSIETDAAYLSCSTPNYPAPAEALQTASFITETSTSFEDGDDEPTTAAPPPTSSPDEPETSPTQPPAETSPTEGTKQLSPAPTAQPPPAETAAPITQNPETTNDNDDDNNPPPQTIGTVQPPAEQNSPTTGAGPAVSAVQPPPASNPAAPPPSTFQTVDIPTTAPDGSPTTAPGIIIGDQTQPIVSTVVPAPSQAAPPPGETAAPPASSIPAIVVGSQTITAGQTATIGTVPVVVPVPASTAGQGEGSPESPPTLSVVPVDQGQQPPASAAPAVTLPNGATAIVNSGSQVVVVGGSQTLQPGANTIAAGSGSGGGSSAATVVLTTDAAGNSVIVADGSTAAIPTAAGPATVGGGAVVTLPGGQTASVDSASQVVVVGGQTLQPGINTIAGDSTVVLTTNAAGATVIVADGSTAALPTAGPAVTAAGAGAIVTLPGGQTASVNGASEIVVVGGDGVATTLSAGANTLPAGTGSAGEVVVTLTTDAAGSTVLVDAGGSAVTVPAGTNAGPVTAVATLPGGQEVVVAAGSSGYVVDGTTLTAGTNVVDGSTVVLTTDADGQTVVVEGGSRTVELTGTGEATGVSTGLGGMILSGLGASGSGRSSTRSASASASGSSSSSRSRSSTSDATATSSDGAAASASESAGAAAAGAFGKVGGGGGWGVLVQGVGLVMCLVFGVVLL
ncbi:hypothetical protein DBV05_g7518 [Lasiodiplodia theobromae]|uniref:Uncharacterized protein n=1 Tax=Lasiodiplodia theobromae TaxID=45133 RepID=A0A5N5D7P9_9PEZI|nr:hypothetical protein DBV05_g7518 [Lasiodiplodia theobromae]